MKNQFAKNKVREVLPIYKMDIFRKYSKWALIPPSLFVLASYAAIFTDIFPKIFTIVQQRQTN